MLPLLFFPVRIVVVCPLGARGDFILAALPGRNMVDIHVVQLLKGTVLTLDDEEIDNKDTDKQTPGEDITIGEVDVLGDEGCEETDEEVPQPVGGSGEGHSLGTILGGEELGGNSPNHRAPGHRVLWQVSFVVFQRGIQWTYSGDEEAGHNNHCLACGGVGLRVIHIEREVADRREDHEEDKHASATDDEGLATTKVLDDVKTAKGGAKVNSTKNDLSDKTVVEASALEDGSSLY